VFKRLRIAMLLYALVAVAVGQYLSSRRATDWDDTLWVDVYLIDEGGNAEAFFAAESQRFGLPLEEPFRIRVADRLDAKLPAIPDNGSMLSAIFWSLRVRWFVTRLHWASDGPTPDITVFAIYHDADSERTLDRSTALSKGMIAIANLFASGHARGSNRMIVAHELLHTLGATDKYDPVTGQPLFPDGFADPDREPLYPQTQAELMGGRIPLNGTEAVIPGSLGELTIGPATAAEIGWLADH